MWTGWKFTNSLPVTKTFVFIFSLKWHGRKIFLLVFKRIWNKLLLSKSGRLSTKATKRGRVLISSSCSCTHHKTYFATAPGRPGRPHCRYFAIILRHTTLGRTPLEEWSARRRGLYLTTHNTHNRQTVIPPVWFEPTISAGEQPQIHALEGAATEIGFPAHIKSYNTNQYNTNFVLINGTLLIFGTIKYSSN